MVSPIGIPGFPRPGTESLNGNQTSGSRNLPQAAEPSGIRTAEDAINVLRARLEQRLEQRFESRASESGKAFAPGQFEPPTAEDVANRVLGFVQQRLQAEAQSGADTERLAGLLEDARAGVEQGFSEARDQIEALGLMNGRLSADIDDSFNRIQDGLADLESRFVTGETPAASPAPVSEAGYRVERASESLFSFEVTTAEGDRVTVEMAEQQYAGASAAFRDTAQGQSGELMAISGFSGSYSFSVEGDLNSDERQALADLFGQVAKVSSRFFDGNIQSAFQQAQKLNLGGDELASFSLSLTSTRVVSAAAYESVSAQPSLNSQLRPLGNLARDLQSVAQSAFGQGIEPPAFEGLMKTLLNGLNERQAEQAERKPEDSEQLRESPSSVSPTLMTDFMAAVIESLNAPGEA